MSEAKNQIESATGFLENIPAFTRALESVLDSQWGWLFLLIFFIWLMANKDWTKLASLLERKEQKKIERLELYKQQCCDSESETQQVILDVRNAYYFKEATGIYAENTHRKALSNFHESYSHSINWKQIKIAMPHIVISKEGKVSIKKMSTLDKITFYYNLFMCGTFLFLGLVLLLTFTTLDSPSAMSFLYGIGGFLAFMCLSLLSLSQNWSMQSAKRIKKEIECDYDINDKTVLE